MRRRAAPGEDEIASSPFRGTFGGSARNGLAKENIRPGGQVRAVLLDRPVGRITSALGNTLPKAVRFVCCQSTTVIATPLR